MRGLLSALLLIAALPIAALGAFSYESITVANTAIGFSDTKITSGHYMALKAFCTAETAQMRFRTDGVDPTASEGHLLDIGQSVTIEGRSDLIKFRAIRTGGTSGTLKCSYE